ncbi:MAG: ribosome maturation factor RimP [Bacteroidetes bacterium]|nr:MAG: ribosome maturation factor RimP [Bacteroidota bacterium]TAG89377.1 MAG: ribosome maturation factor RimP [Bacteroidota bacterium]
MSIEEKIKNYLNEIIDSQYFVINVIYKKTRNSNGSLKILLDGDKGIGIDACVETSRKLGAWLDEQDWLTDAYNLEVSSPGADMPLEFLRQFSQHIGRSLEITTKDEKVIEAKLLEVKDEENKIMVLPIITKKSKTKEEITPVIFDFNEIKKAIVIISFK